MAEIKKINNYDIKDETARNAIDEINNKLPEGTITTEQYVQDAIGEINSKLPEDTIATEQYVQNAIGDINAILDAINGEVL